MKSIISKTLIVILLIETTFLSSLINAQYLTFAEDMPTNIDVEHQTSVKTQTTAADDILGIADKAADMMVSLNPLALTSFSTNGHSVYHLRPVKIDQIGTPAIVAASFDGTVLCYKQDGTLIWKRKVNEFFPFDLAVADIDNDGLDEIFVATGGGTLDALDSDGTQLWTFKSEAQLYQVCPVKNDLGKWVIITGGIEETVFSVDTDGRLLKSYPAGDVIRHIRKGDVYGNGKEYVAVATTSSGLNGRLSILLMNPTDLGLIWRKANLGNLKESSRFFSMLIKDINSDGRKDIIMGGSWHHRGRLLAYDYKGDLILTSNNTVGVPRANYRMNLLTDIDVMNSDEDFIFGVFANYLIIYNSNGIMKSLLTSKYDFSNGAYDPKTNTFFLGSSVAGGDGIYALHLNQKGWESVFEAIQPVGKLAAYQANLETLKTQIKNFQPPVYQTRQTKVDLIAWVPKGQTYNNLNFEIRRYLLQKITDKTEIWCKEIDKRYAYDLTQAQIIDYVKEREAKHEDFYIVCGHSEAVYMPLETMEKAIAAGPNHLKGFMFAEMEKINSRMEEIIQHIILPLAGMCKKSGKKIVFENKNVFWGGSCYVDFWKNLLIDSEFHDVFMPALEESNSRSQEISLAGRLGLWTVGAFDQWVSRTISDNPCFDRMWEWSSPQLLSHYLRNIVYTASLGSDILTVNIQQGKPLSEEVLYPQIFPVYEMLDKGIVAIPKRHELLSVPDICLGMKSPPSDAYLTDGINGHKYTFKEDDHSPKVFDHLGTNWGGTQISDHDFSGYGYGVERRMLNFLPKAPYGLVAIIPDDTDLTKISRFKEKITTDGEFFYDSNGLKVGAEAYKATMLQKLEESAARLPVLVKGDAAWSAVRIDSTHVRITLIDPGYTDIADRNVEVALQHLTGIDCRDILSRESLTIIGNKIQIAVPAGLFRIIDITHSDLDNISWSGIEVLDMGISMNPDKDVNKTPLIR